MLELLGGDLAAVAHSAELLKERTRIGIFRLLLKETTPENKYCCAANQRERDENSNDDDHLLARIGRGFLNNGRGKDKEGQQASIIQVFKDPGCRGNQENDD